MDSIMTIVARVVDVCLDKQDVPILSGQMERVEDLSSEAIDLYGLIHSPRPPFIALFD